MSTKKINDVLLQEKAEIIEKYKMPKNGAKCARNANLEKSRRRTGKGPQIEDALKGWSTKVRNKNARVNRPLLRQIAEALVQTMGKHEFIASVGWMNRCLLLCSNATSHEVVKLPKRD